MGISILTEGTTLLGLHRWPINATSDIKTACVTHSLQLNSGLLCPLAYLYDELIALCKSRLKVMKAAALTKGLCLKRAAYKINPFNCHCRFHAVCVTTINPASAVTALIYLPRSVKPPLRKRFVKIVKQLPAPLPVDDIYAWIQMLLSGCYDDDDRSCCQHHHPHHHHHQRP